MNLPPVAYVGPSLDAAEIRRCLPTVQLMPPVRRGDLYRDRLLGFDTFLVIDGVFFQDLAISPREVIDVLRDGATVVGAASMGAIRAAECWPAGMRGVGAIYRMFRRGLLTSDEDVAVKCYPLPPYSATTVPLVNVRYAVSRAVRAGLLSRAVASGIVQAAMQCHYADRTWSFLLRRAGIAPDSEGLIDVLSSHDLKRRDARRAVKCVAEGLIGMGARPQSPRWPPRFVESYRPREASLHEPVSSMPSGRREAFWQWLLGTGRYRTYLNHAADAGSSRRLEIGEDRPERGHGARNGSLDGAVAPGPTSVRLLEQFSRHDDPAANAIWASLASSGELDGLVLRFTAVSEAAAWARELSLTSSADDEHLARLAVAARHGFRSWADLQTTLGGAVPPWALIERACQWTALAKRVRHELFSGRISLATSGLSAEGRTGGQP